MNLEQLNSIGSGAYFPIMLTTVIGEDGKPETVTLPDGTVANKISWRPISGDLNLIKQNLISILTFQIGQRIREEMFGCRTWECIGEQNTQALAYMIQDFVMDGISSWEPRISSVNVKVFRDVDRVNLRIYYTVGNNDINTLDFSYNPQNNTTYAY